MTNEEKTTIFDDQYFVYSLPDSCGLYHIKTPKISFSTPIYLAVNGDVDYQSEGIFDHLEYSLYNLQIYAPKQETIKLSFRRNQIAVGSWANLAQPFYSGGGCYEFKLKGTYTNGFINLPQVACSWCEVYLDGRLCGASGLPPFCFELGDIRGEHILKIRIVNTMANQLENYRAPGGILSPPVIYSLKH